jgi:hypothetical protein
MCTAANKPSFKKFLVNSGRLGVAKRKVMNTSPDRKKQTRIAKRITPKLKLIKKLIKEDLGICFPCLYRTFA